MTEITPSAADLIRWAEALSGIARTGLGFTQSLYERERFEEVLKVASDIRATAPSSATVVFSTTVRWWSRYLLPPITVGD